MVYFLLRFGLARRPFHLFSKRRRGIPAAPRLKEIRFLKDLLVKASFISIVSALCAPQNRAGCILSVCRLLCRVLVSLHPCPPAVYKPLRRLAFPFCQATLCQQIPRGSGFSHPHEMSQKGPSEVCCSFEICSCCRCSAQAEEGGGRCSVLGAAQEAADAGRCVCVTWRRCWSRCPAAVICFFSAFPGPTECPEAPLVRAVPAAESRRGPSQTVQQGEKQPANCYYLFIFIFFFTSLSCLALTTNTNVSEYLDHC